VRTEVDFGTAELVPDRSHPGGWTLFIDDTPQSYVDIARPDHLEFEYVRHLAAIVDELAPEGEPVRVLHLGGGGLTMPRYVAASRPGSTQLVVERDAALVDLVRQHLPLPRGANLRVRVADGRAVVESATPGRYDLIITDVYGGARVPAQFSTVEFLSAAARLLRPGGWYAANLADRRPLRWSRDQVATARAVFADVCLIADPAVLRGRRFGNLVLAGAAPVGDDAPEGAGRLPVDDLARVVARDMFPGRVLHAAELSRFASGAHAITDATAVESPPPPAGLF
jgi:protein-L-isoaspartate O-methyltransferase